MTVTDRDVHAGILVKAGDITVTIGERRNAGKGPGKPLDLYPIDGIADRTFALDEGVTDVRVAENRLRQAVKHVVKKCPNLVAVGVGCYGPISNLDIDARERGSKSGYGVIWRHSRHRNLRQLNVYQTVMDALVHEKSACRDVRCHSDVSCGAIAESLDRTIGARPIPPGSVVYLANIAEGVGGGIAMGGRPWIGALHSEAGYAAAQLVRNDYYGWVRFVEAGPDYAVFMEQLIDRDAILRRTGYEQLADIPLTHRQWVLVAEYCAQLAQLAAVVISPARVVMHGPVFDVNKGLLSEVRRRFKSWLETSRNVRPVHYRAMDEPGFIDRPSCTNPMLRGALLLSALKIEDLRSRPAVWVPGKGRK